MACATAWSKGSITSAKLGLLSRAIFQLDLLPGRQLTIYGEMIKSIDEISDEREQRVGAASVQLHPEFWTVTVLLDPILVPLSTVIKAIAYHTVSIAARGLAVALLAALVFCSDHPFKGISVSSAPIINVLTIMKART